jgi:bifunctional isochorismate lyase/aryl carrier protein
MPAREQYFSPENIDQQSQEMYASLQGMGLVKIRPFHPHSAALLVLDMQEVFSQPASHAHIPSMKAIIPRLVRLIEAFSNQKLTVVFTQHLNSPADAGLMATWWRDLIGCEHPYAALIPELDVTAGKLFLKTRYDAFMGTSLEEFLIEKGVEQVVICGVMTHLCCETTARSAFMRGFEVFFTIDGTATYNEAFHRATLLNLAHGFATPVLMQDILDNPEMNGRG